MFGTGYPRPTMVTVCGAVSFGYTPNLPTPSGIQLSIAGPVSFSHDGFTESRSLIVVPRTDTDPVDTMLWMASIPVGVVHTVVCAGTVTWYALTTGFPVISDASHIPSASAQ